LGKKQFILLPKMFCKAQIFFLYYSINFEKTNNMGKSNTIFVYKVIHNKMIKNISFLNDYEIQESTK